MAKARTNTAVSTYLRSDVQCFQSHRYVQHTLGWPLQAGPFDKTFGGSFLYHISNNQVLVGFVVGLDYENPYLNPYVITGLPQFVAYLLSSRGRDF